MGFQRFRARSEVALLVLAKSAVHNCGLLNESSHDGHHPREPNEVIVEIESEAGPVSLSFQPFGAATLARDMSTASTQAIKLGRAQSSELAPGREELVAPQATLEDYGQDIESGDVILRLRDEQGVLHIFRVAPNEVFEFAEHALLNREEQSDDGSSRH